MNEADGTFPTTLTGKRKRRYGFRYSTKKALECSRLSKKTAKGRVLEFASVTKALTYPSALLSEIGVVDLGDCSTGSIGLASVHSVGENQEERIDACIGNVVSVAECYNKVNII
jgi:hypothetical protein